ncbi:MAG: PAC2 family protein [Chloroflexota bacterium]
MPTKGNLAITEKPTLRQPNMVCGISGWVDGGEVATGSIDYLRRQLRAKKFAEIPASRFHIYQVPGQIGLRPYVKMGDGLVKEHRFPKNEFFYWVNPAGANDLILFKGTEPNLYWEEYIETITGLAGEFSVNRICILGGVLDETPHTREPSVSCGCTSPQLKEELEKYRVRFSNYEGPSSFGTTLLYICRQQKQDAISMTARATYYPEFNIVIPRNPKAIRAVLKRLNHMMHLNLDFSDLNKDVSEFEGKLEFMRSQSPRFHAHIEELEKNYVELDFEEPLELSPDEAVKFAEEFLKQKKDEKGEGGQEA